jgi:hypothetical protein
LSVSFPTKKFSASAREKARTFATEQRSCAEMVVGPQKDDAGYWTFWKVEGDAQHERLSTAERLCAGKKRAGWKE